MAAGLPPANFGGGQALMADPNEAGLSNSMRDMAVLTLRMAHYVRANANNADQGAIDAIADGVRQVLQASEVTQARELATRELQPLTRVPPAAYGAQNNPANIRMQNVPTFTGTGHDEDVVRWLSRVLNLARCNLLTFEATIALLIQASSGGVADYIEQMRDEGKNIYQVVQQLEMRYGDLCTPEEARVRCNNMPRRDKESLPEFIDRLRRTSRMACRLEADDAARVRAMDVLVEGNIRRVLPSSVRSALEERVINRSRMGLPSFTAREIEKECLELEKRRDERRNNYGDPVFVKKHANARAAQVNRAFESSSDDKTSSDDDVDTSDDATHHLVSAIKQEEKRYERKGKPFDRDRIYRRAFRQYNDKFPPKRPWKNPSGQGVRQAGAYHNPAQQGPPNKLDTGKRRTVLELLTLANVTRGHCIQCGIEKHFMHSDACALKDKPLVDRPCVKCGTGLHSADDCPKVFQHKYVTPQQNNQANVVSDDTLNI